jgi:hypothetical protein
VIKQQVNEKLVARNLQPELTPHERKACSQFEQEAGNVLNQAVFDFAFVRLIAQPQEIEQVGVFQGLLRQRRIVNRVTI